MTGKPGRPPVGPPLQIRLTRELLERVDQVVARDGWPSRAAFIRSCLEEALDDDA